LHARSEHVKRRAPRNIGNVRRAGRPSAITRRHGKLTMHVVLPDFFWQLIDPSQIVCIDMSTLTLSCIQVGHSRNT
jgi:hypothetical protein